ncbi:hypothetical protein N7495_008812 [Penicillium taxi]|uniref:uncharacterized protein n=1 Tax=Penicillium taxi TaxID=168475 RepID=UPI002544F060|nr:uncharacterized protein N7495_008812 [Penicillium taxi]KAJ5888771.1 hypothetical protein N7495_008812 [Penicillium taxi]
MNRMPPPDGPHVPTSVHGVYDHGWRGSSYPQHPPFDSHLQDTRRQPTTQTSLAPGYPINRELPQLPLDGHFARQGSLPGPPEHNQHSQHPGFRPSINGSPHDASPHSAPPEVYRSRLSYPPAEQPTVSESIPPPVSLPQTTQFMTPTPAMTNGAPAYDAGYYQNPAFGARQRKAARAQQACDQCRARKAKCDEGRPACSHCKENNLICVYKEVPPHKQEKTAQLIMERILELEEKLMERLDKHSEVLQRLTSEEDLETKPKSKSEPQPQSQSQSQIQSKLNYQSPVAAPISHVPLAESKSPAIREAPLADQKSPYYGQAPNPAATIDPNFDDPKNENEGELSIPVEHTTAAHKLLMWPSIKKLLVDEYDEDYVMRLEEERGLINPFGQGEVSESADGSQLMSPPMPLGAKRMNGTANYKAEPESSLLNPSPDAGLQIDNDGWVALDKTKVSQYYNSYIAFMHKLHPFLNQIELMGWMKMFMRKHCLKPSSESSPTLCREDMRPTKRKRSNDYQGHQPGYVDSACASFEKPPRQPLNPRMTQTSSFEERLNFSEEVVEDEVFREPVGHNIESAIVLLVLAVGAICQTPSPLPGPLMQPEALDYMNQYIPRPFEPLPPRKTPTNVTSANGVLSPANSDSGPRSFYNNTRTPIPSFTAIPPAETPGQALRRQDLAKAQEALARRRTWGGTKNLEAIPGLALYGYATRILGELQGGVTLHNVQAGLLAGLYAGQLAHPFQSHSWICQAARACAVLVRQKLYERMADEFPLDLYHFAYWTCLQLESDLLAELDIPASGISRSEVRMEIPKGLWTISLPDDLQEPNTMMMMFYSAQIHLRKVLNRVHTDLYKVEKQGEARWSSSVQEALSLNLEAWRKSLPDTMQWSDNDPPSTDINAARMRAKYYGARYIIHRPLLYYALHYGQGGAEIVKQPSAVSPSSSATASQPQNVSPSIPHTNHRATNMTRGLSDMSTPTDNSSSFPNGWTPPTVHPRKFNKKFRVACQTCVNSARLSTVAFDNITPERLVVTNIFGTAHAQFGNMLVLSATFMSSLKSLVDPADLQALLNRTINFLLRNKNISPTLRADAKILTQIYLRIFKEQPLIDPILR